VAGGVLSATSVLWTGGRSGCCGGCGEDQAVVAGVGGDVLGEDVDEMRSTLALARPEAVQQVETVDNM